MHLIDTKPLSRRLAASLPVLVSLLSACGDAQPGAVVDEPVAVLSTCGGQGMLQAALAGAIEVQLDWPDAALRCDSMPRPDAQGIRMRFSGPVGDEWLDIIIALPELDADEAGADFDSNVTISVAGSARFFSTPNLDTCWTDVAGNQVLADQSGTRRVVGSLSCVGPLGEVNGDGFVDIRSLRFSGIANWGSE